MKIAYISPIYFSDVDLSYLQELSKYADVYYFFPLGPITKGAAINVEKLVPHSEILPATAYPELDKFKHIINIEKTFIINNGNNSRIQNLILTFKLLRKIHDLHIDIIHITEIPNWNYFPLYAKRKNIVLSVHDPFVHSCVTSKWYEFRRKCAFSLLENFIIFNKNQREAFIKHYKLEKKLVFDSHLSTYTYLHMYQKPTKQKQQVLFFGQITSHKGLEYLLPAMELVHQQHPDTKLVVAGKGQFHFDISSYQDKNYIDIRNRFIPDEELAELIQESYLVVCPYKDATQSGVIMSAYAFGIPVIATNVGGLPEMVTHNKTGIIIQPCNIQAITDAVSSLIKDSTLHLEMSQNITKQYAHSELSWNHIVVDVYNNVYKTIANKA
jgi:glycosyltransferase involved in cell wall biosynthesis